MDSPGLVDFVELVVGVLAVATMVGIGLVLIGALVGRSGSGGVFVRSANWILTRRLLFTAGIGVVATVASLYFSEIVNFIPCRWCWYQRTMMYPIGIIGLVALYRRDRASRPYFVALSGIGALMSTWHSYLEIFNVASDSCALTGAACNEVYFRSLGFLSLANMALIGFVGVLVLNSVSISRSGSADDTAGAA